MYVFTRKIGAMFLTLSIALTNNTYMYSHNACGVLRYMYTRIINAYITYGYRYMLINTLLPDGHIHAHTYMYMYMYMCTCIIQ